MDVIVNAAMSADGKLSTTDRRQIPISGPEDFDRVDRLRSSVDAIMVGIGTVLADDPRLTAAESGEDEQPARVVADSSARIPLDAALLDESAPVHLLVAETAPAGRLERLKSVGTVHVVGTDQVDLRAGIAALADHGIDSLLVEGGGELIFSLLATGVVDRLSVFVGGCVIGGRDAPTLADGDGFTEIDAFVNLALSDVERLDDGVLLTWTIAK